MTPPMLPVTGDTSVAAQRMDALGRLAGGVAHDFNNVLMVINGYAELLVHCVGDDADAKEAVEAILEAAERGRAMTRQLSAFGRRQAVEPMDMAMGPVVRTVGERLRRLVPDTISLHVSCEDTSLVARVDPGQFEHVVLTLAAHARDAMPQGGVLSVSVEGGARDAFVDAAGDRAPAGSYVRVAVSDTGTGLDETARLRIFEPFFAPTGKGKGAALHLAAVFGIVKGSGGFLYVTSAVGQGTTFELYFPQVAPPTRVHDLRLAIGGRPGERERGPSR